MNTFKRKAKTERMVLGAVLTALVVILQLMGSFIRFGTFSVSLVLIPIVIGAATCGTGVGTWLGLVFGVTVLLSGDANLFMSISIPGTIITVLLKGILCGLCAGGVYKLLEKTNYVVAVLLTAVVCPLMNTGVFLLGCKLFFMETITGWANGTDVGLYLITGLVGFNFIFELVFNIVLGPMVVRLLNIAKNKK